MSSSSLPSPLFGYCFTSSASSFIHQVLCNTHTDDLLLRVSTSLILHVEIYKYAIAFLHNILDSFSISSVFTAMHLWSFQAKLCIHGVAILHTLLGSLLVLVVFNFQSPASLSCNPYLGSRGCIQPTSISIWMWYSQYT